MLAIALAGLARCGKDTAADFLRDKFGFEKFVFSDLLKEELAKRDMEETRLNKSIVGDEIRKQFGMGVLGERMWQKINGKEKVVLVGCRSIEETDFLKKEIDGGFFVVAINSNIVSRFKRSTSNDPTENSFNFKQRDARDIKMKGLDKLLAKADFVVQNNSTKSVFYKKLSVLVKKLEKNQ